MLFAKFTHPDAGLDSDIAKANALLTVGHAYQVTEVDMGSCHTEIWLAGFVEPFNSVQFDFYEHGVELDIYRSPRYNPYLRGCRSANE